jgi:hypothetical protein
VRLYGRGVATILGHRLSLIRALGRRGPRGLLEACSRRRLARAVRRHARNEREHLHRGGVIEFRSIAARTALYEGIAARLEDLDLPVAVRGIESIERLLAEPAPFRDYGPRAWARNARIGSVLADLEVEQTDTGTDLNRWATELFRNGRSGAVRADRSVGPEA